MDEREREEMEADERRRADERKRELEAAEEKAKAEQQKMYGIIAWHLVREMLPALAEGFISSTYALRAEERVDLAHHRLNVAHELATAFVAKASEAGIGMAAKNLIMLGSDSPQQSVPVPPHLQRQLQDALSGRGGPAGKLFGG